MKQKCYDFFKENKWIILISTIFLGVLIYCTLNTTLASDDYPYSLFYRGGARITELSQIVANQLSDYKNINGRIVTNGLGQFLLMFDRPVFAVLNSFVLLITFLLILKLISYYHKISNKQKCIILLLSMSLFFSLDSVKYLVYWVMGATNYIWMLPLILLFLCYYAKNGLFSHPILESFYIAIVSSFHESLLVFFIVFLISNFIYDMIKNKKVRKQHLYYFIAILFAVAFIFLSPGNQLRNSTWYPEWNKLNWFTRLSTTIPVVGKTMFEFSIAHNIVPFIFFLVIFTSCMLEKTKTSRLWGLVLFFSYLLAIITNQGWIYVIYSGVLFLSEAYLHCKNKNDIFIFTSLGFYAIVYSMILTPEYAAGRPNYFMYFYMITMIGFFLLPWLKDRKVSNIILVFVLLFASYYSGRELIIYHEMGEIIKDRNQAILDVKEGKEDVVYLKSIPKHLRRYHMEPNTPADEYYWAHKYFCTYYGIPKDTKIKLVK